MEANARVVTREHYQEMLIDASFRDASEMEAGFLSWCERHAATWREQGYDERWIRQRIETAQHTRRLHRTCKEQGLTMLAIREELRTMYAAYPALYDLALERERLHPGPLQYRGNTSDLRQRYTLRVMVYEADKLASEKFCRWSDLPAPDPSLVFFEQPDSVRVVRDLSTVEELELALAMSRSLLQLFTESEPLTRDQIAPRMEAYGEQLRADFLASHGYAPEDSATPYVPVTIEGPRTMMSIMRKTALHKDSTDQARRRGILAASREGTLSMHLDHFQALAQELHQMGRADQAMSRGATWDASLDVKHTLRLKQIIADIGWPTTNLKGWSRSFA